MKYCVPAVSPVTSTLVPSPTITIRALLSSCGALVYTRFALYEVPSDGAAK